MNIILEETQKVMASFNEDNLRYPIGRFQFNAKASEYELEEAIKTIAVFPEWLRETTLPLNSTQLNATYRNYGWTVRQIVHHLADSHVNAYIRFRLALTENTPTIKPYNEAAWAELHDAKFENINASLAIIDAIHERWVRLIEQLDSKEFTRAFMHPEHNRLISLAESVCMYAWHCRHHLGHIQRAIERGD